MHGANIWCKITVVVNTYYNILFFNLLSAYHFSECFSYIDQKQNWKKNEIKGKEELISVQLNLAYSSSHYIESFRSADISLLSVLGHTRKSYHSLSWASWPCIDSVDEVLGGCISELRPACAAIRGSPLIMQDNLMFNTGSMVCLAPIECWGLLWLY